MWHKSVYSAKRSPCLPFVPLPLALSHHLHFVSQPQPYYFFLTVNLCFFGKTFGNYIFSNKMLVVVNISSSFEKQDIIPLNAYKEGTDGYKNKHAVSGF